MHTCKCVVACAASVSWPQSVSPLVSFLNQNHWLKPTSLQTGWREIERLTSAAEACSEKFWMDGWKDGDRGFKEIALFFPDCGFFFFLPFDALLNQPLRWECSCSVPRNGGKHTHWDIKRDFRNAAGRQASVSLSVRAALLLGTVQFLHYPLHAHVYACVCFCWPRCRWLLRTGQKRRWQLAFGREGREAAKEEGEGVDEVSKDSCIAELYLLQSTILHCTSINPLRLKSSTLERIRWMWTGFLSLSVWWALLIYVHMYLHACQQC